MKNKTKMQLNKMQSIDVKVYAVMLLEMESYRLCKTTDLPSPEGALRGEMLWPTEDHQTNLSVWLHL